MYAGGQGRGRDAGGPIEGIFRDLFTNHTRLVAALPQGSGVLVGSLSHPLLGLTTYVEDLVKISNSLISLTVPGVTICLLVSVPLSGISDAKTIVDMANLNSCLVSNISAPNICLPNCGNQLWRCSAIQRQHFCGHWPNGGNSLSMPVSLTNWDKRRFAAGMLRGPYMVSIQPLDSCMESEIITALTKELNDSHCLSLPAAPALDRGSEFPMPELDGKRVVVIGSSHAGKLSTLLAASLATKFLKHPLQSQTPEAAEDLADDIIRL